MLSFCLIYLQSVKRCTAPSLKLVLKIYWPVMPNYQIIYKMYCHFNFQNTAHFMEYTAEIIELGGGSIFWEIVWKKHLPFLRNKIFILRLNYILCIIGAFCTNKYNNFLLKVVKCIETNNVLLKSVIYLAKNCWYFNYDLYLESMEETKNTNHPIY